MRRTRGFSPSASGSKKGGSFKPFASAPLQVPPLPLASGLGTDYHTAQVLTNVSWSNSAMRRRVPMSGATVVQRGARVEVGSRREIERLMSKLGSMPRILCWKCRKLTPFESEKCQHCGAAFAGGTGGAYGSGYTPAMRSGHSQATRSRPNRESSRSPSKRTITEIFEDLQRVHHEVASSHRERSAVFGDSSSLYQCPSCGRFVSERSTECLCGVRFAGFPTETFVCPECGSHVPSDADACPVCQIGFEVEGARSANVYACPRCGTHVASDAVRCSCGAWFED